LCRVLCGLNRQGNVTLYATNLYGIYILSWAEKQKILKI
jgi:hypothetical protein